VTYTTITYVQPLNERLRFFMRLSFLFSRLKHGASGETTHDSHTAITTLLDILNIIQQQDLKKEVLKEIERINQTLTPLQHNTEIEHSTLDQILSTLSTYRSELHAASGPMASELRHHEFLKTLQQRYNVPAGLSECDPPVYNHWLHKPIEQRKSDLSQWLETFETLHNAIDLILQLIKQSANPSRKIADNGIYQQTLDASAPFQLVMVTLPVDSRYFAEISGGKHRFTVRFMDTTTKPRPVQTSDEVAFDLYCCAL
jgi:cell division protein ZapD